MKRLLIVMMIIALVAIAACKPEQLQDQPLGAGNADDSGTTATDTKQDVTEETKTAGDAKAGLKTIFEKYGKLEYMVAYDVTATNDGKTEKTKMTQYLKGESMRMDVSGNQDGKTYEARTFITPLAFITCSKDETEWQCIKMEAPEDQQQDLAAKYEEEGDAFWDGNQVYNEPDRTIAGVKAKCFKLIVTIPEQGTMTEIGCYSPEGVPLYIEIKTPQGTNVMQATSYKTTVTAADFVPPVEPQDLDAMMAQYGVDPSQYGG